MPREDDVKTKREASEAMALANSEQRKKLAAAEAAAAEAEAASKLKRRLDESEVKFVLEEPAHTNDWQAIIVDYKKEFGCGPDEKTGVLIFPTMDAAIQFFDKQAKPPNKREFLATEYVNGVAKDFHLFSCGDERLYQGTFAEIKAQLEKALKDHPENAKTLAGLKLIAARMPGANAVSEMREQLKGHRQMPADEEQQASPVTQASAKR